MAGAVRFLEILSALVRHEVAFIVVGGVAAVLEGAPVMTFDVDVVYARDPENNQRLLAALRELNARYKDPGGRSIVPDAERLQSMNVHLLETDLGPLDLPVRLRGDLEYPALLERSVGHDLGGFAVTVLAIDAVIECKRFANRDN